MARSTMATLITELRGMCAAGTVDYTISGVAYWSDDQLQAELDRRRTNVTDEVLYSEDDNFGGTVNTTRYYSGYRNFETTNGGSAVFTIRDANHDLVGTADYTVDYQRGEVTFVSSTGGSTYYLTGRSYDLYASAADVWEKKAAHTAIAAFSWSSDNMRVDKKGLRAEAMSMAQYYRSMSGPASVTIERGDT